MRCEIFIKELDGKTRSVCVNSEEELKNTTVEEFIRRLCPEEDLKKFIYIFNGQVLEDDSTLAFYGMKQFCTVIKRIRLRGGAPPAEDGGEGMPRNASMDRLTAMQQTEPEPNR
ncbi:ubiquitin-like protein ISG15 [Onychostoma macrolepis]|uniref:Ubiquitin-like domain-containing protein n=1 Tax=Onychostoma macrolepis TaxID=369639 RepID=A0A7J6BM35_9TELE|nr:ubiquitin-like protein ISG15 [Onychostoma macrolepis]KAF4094712.1 hypothetical protein G5714_023790 [Onychostoma macrolepis]